MAHKKEINVSEADIPPHLCSFVTVHIHKRGVPPPHAVSEI